MAKIKHPLKAARGKRPRTADVETPVPRKKRPIGRERMNLMVDRAMLARAAAGAGTTNMSEVVNMALRRMAEDDAIIAGIDAAFGAIPDFPFVDT